MSTNHYSFELNENRYQVHYIANDESRPLPISLSRCVLHLASLLCLCSIVSCPPLPLCSPTVFVRRVLSCRIVPWSLSPSPSAASGTLMSGNIMNHLVLILKHTQSLYFGGTYVHPSTICATAASPLSGNARNVSISILILKRPLNFRTECIYIYYFFLHSNLQQQRSYTYQ